jgi:hypothetical protein
LSTTAWNSPPLVSVARDCTGDGFRAGPFEINVHSRQVVGPVEELNFGVLVVGIAVARRRVELVRELVVELYA